jgi:hypothetical protein
MMFTKDQWEKCQSPMFMMLRLLDLKKRWRYRLGCWVGQHRPPVVNARILGLLACACCRRVWAQIEEASVRNHIDVFERYLDGQASVVELQKATADAEACFDLNVRADDEHPKDALYELPFRLLEVKDEFSVLGPIGAAAQIVGWAVGQSRDVVDGAAVEREQAEQAELVRHIIGCPFQRVPSEREYSAEIFRLAGQMYNGSDKAAQLQKALMDGDHSDLAHHFGTRFHPKGCWVIEHLLGR